MPYLHLITISRISHEERYAGSAYAVLHLSSSMDPDSPYHGMNSIYDADRQRRSWNNGLPHLQPPYQEHPGQPGAHTLPPIQSQRPSFDHGAGLFEQQPRQHPALYSTQANAYPTYASQAPLPSYGQALPHFPVTSSMLASTGPTMPMTQAYANPTTSAFPQIRPMPAPTSAHGLSMSHGYMPSASFGYPNSTDDNDLQPRTHVVGSQGRRGILPSAEGKPSAVTSNGHTVPKSTVIPQKDADGKFPCPHCQKTYLHGKHLKRHLLRRKCGSISSLTQSLTSLQTRAIGHTHAFSARTPFLAVTF